jgi:DNA modification methylase
MKIKKRKIKDLIRAEYNPRKITQIEEFDLRESLMRFGLVEPIIININKERKDIVIGGHQRLKIWQELGNDEIDCNQIDLTLDKERELNIRLNKNGGSFDDELIKEYFDYEELTEWGFTPDELFEPDEKTIDGLIEDDEIPEVKESKVKRGDIWQLGEHRIMCGDSTSSDDVEKLMNGEKADMLFTDPPYGVNYEGGHNKEKRNGIKNDKLEGKDLSNLFKNSIITSLLFTKDSSPFYIWYASGKSIETFKGLSETGINVRAIICWYKVKSGLGAFMAQYIPNYEPCIYGYKQGKSIKWYGATDEKTVWELPNDNKNKLHPTQKPIALGERAINNSSKANDIIFDMFLGSGSTLIAAEKLNRKCYGMELDEKYCDVIIERWEQFTGKKAKKIN